MIQINVIPLDVKDLKDVYVEHCNEMEGCIHQERSVRTAHEKVISISKALFVPLNMESPGPLAILESQHIRGSGA